MNFIANATTPYSAFLTWSPPPFEQQNGVITGYVINVTVLGSNISFTLYSNTSSYFVNTLKPFRTYICIIAAQTSIGMGPFGQLFILRTPQAG